MRTRILTAITVIAALATIVHVIIKACEIDQPDSLDCDCLHC